jgi:type I restriction enzyme M protein
MKYVSDKGDKLVDIPAGGSFYDMVKLKGQPDIGNQMNIIIGKLAGANSLNGIITVADFNDDEKLGKGKDKVDRLSNLIEIFENESLNFRSNRVENDDLLGDAYEYLMRHFATESGKSKGQFYTPAEVSRVMAKLIGIEQSQSPSETLYDMACGSGSLLLKAADEAPNGITIYGQEMDNATRALAVMNMWLHGHPDAEILQGNTIAEPLFLEKENSGLKKFDYAVANPPFSTKAWSNGLDEANDIYERFDGFGIPPQKNGDYAFLLHLLKSLKSKGKAAIIMPLGVLFRGNIESEIRRNIVKRGYIKGIIGLPDNLFYGTGIAACIIVLDKENAAQRKGIFMINAAKGFMKDGNKNRLRSQDIHKMVDTFTKQLKIPGYSRMVPFTEIADPKNDFNLNLPRYIDTQEEEDIQDIDAHLNGGIPQRNIDALSSFWEVYPNMKEDLFTPADREGYFELKTPAEEIRKIIFDHPDFKNFSGKMQNIFNAWQTQSIDYLRSLNKDCHPKAVINHISENILDAYKDKGLHPGQKGLLDRYDIYQQLMDYWSETMQDDLYEIAAEGWEAGNILTRLTRKTKRGLKDIPGIDGLSGRLIPTGLMIEERLSEQKNAVDKLQNELDSTVAEMESMREEHGTEDGPLADALDDKGKITKASLNAALKEVDKSDKTQTAILKQYKKLMDKEATLKVDIKTALTELEEQLIQAYPPFTIEDIKEIVIEQKWMAEINRRINNEMEAISHRLTTRIKTLAERYQDTLPQLTNNVEDLKAKVEEHLKAMKYNW